MRVKKCRGPSEPHKITSEVLAYLNEFVRAEPQLKARQLAARIGKRFKLKVHPRTIEKALKPKANYGRFKLNASVQSKTFSTTILNLVLAISFGADCKRCHTRSKVITRFVDPNNWQ